MENCIYFTSYMGTHLEAAAVQGIYCQVSKKFSRADKEGIWG